MDGQRIAAPRYNLTRIFRLRDMLADDKLTEFCGYVPIGEHFEDLVDKICATIPRVKRLAVWDSVRDVAGTLLTDDDVFRMSWRLAGNIGLLRSGTPVPPWHVQQEKEWMPVQTLSYREGLNNRGQLGGHFRMRVLAGTACPLRLTKFWTRRFCRFVSNKMGYSASWGDYPLGHISELVGLRLWIQIDPEQCRPGLPGFMETGVTPGLQKWNRDIVKKRFRRGWACPYNFDHYCYVCPVGYLDCPAATHKETVHVEPQTAGPHI